MIAPSVGRVVWFFGKGDSFHPAMGNPPQPHAAMVTFVHGDRLVNLIVYSAVGIPYSRTGVKLLQDDDPEPQGEHAVWMPYQLGQAKKTEELEQRIDRAAAAGAASVSGF